MHILSKDICDNMRKVACLSDPGNTSYFRDYVERLCAYFNLEIQSDHFDNGRSLSIESCNIELVDS